MEKRRDTDGGPNPYYNIWEDAIDVIATHLQEDDTAYKDRNEAERQARRIAHALIRKNLVICWAEKPPQ